MSRVSPEHWKHEDPYPEHHGILLSNHIDQLCLAGFLISKGYDQKYLRPASYTLTIGREYWDSAGESHVLTDDEDSFVFKKNSIVYVSAAEEFNLPYYVIARFNLRVTWVYEGILLGTGPQVDPGFRGRLSCPLYNLTNLDITIKRGAEFATIDFEKTTPFLQGLSVEQKVESLKKNEKARQIEIDEHPYVLFTQKPFSALQLHPSHVLISSLQEMRDEVKTWRNVGLGLVVAFIGLTVALLNWGNNLTRQIVDNAKQLQDNQTKIEVLKQQVDDEEKAESSEPKPAEKQNRASRAAQPTK
jgi:deoxycytidine triphosphate deaminase